jgi:hypothetical protein
LLWGYKPGSLPTAGPYLLRVWRNGNLQIIIIRKPRLNAAVYLNRRQVAEYIEDRRLTGNYGVEALGQKAHAGIALMHVPYKTCSAVDGSFEPVRLPKRHIEVEEKSKAPVMLARKLTHLKLTRMRRGAPIHMSGAFERFIWT